MYITYTPRNIKIREENLMDNNYCHFSSLQVLYLLFSFNKVTIIFKFKLQLAGNFNLNFGELWAFHLQEQCIIIIATASIKDQLCVQITKNALKMIHTTYHFWDRLAVRFVYIWIFAFWALCYPSFLFSWAVSEATIKKIGIHTNTVNPGINSKSPLTWTKFHFPWLSPHFPVIFTRLTWTKITWITCYLELNFLSLGQKFTEIYPRQ